MVKILLEDTIAAISTPLGEGGIGIVRLSGPEAFDLVQRLFVPAKPGTDYPQHHLLYYGHLKRPEGGVLDEVLVSFHRAPYTYTCEDITEINCHSGALALRMILKLVLEAGARMAEPGEFTRRAFLNGRIDLVQAESVLKIIRAKSERAVKMAAGNLTGLLSRSTGELRRQIMQMMGRVEAHLDFPEEMEEESLDLSQLAAGLTGVRRGLEDLLRGADRGIILQEGIATAIIGRPNVGKSALLNALLRQQRALVHEIPGTTRDLLEGYLHLQGYPLRLIDTAGIRGTADPVERMGVALSRKAAGEAGLLLAVLDGSSTWTGEDAEIASIAATAGRVIVVINKADLPRRLRECEIAVHFPGKKAVETIAIREGGVEPLEKAIVDLLDRGQEAEGAEPILASMRHIAVVRESLDAIYRAKEALENKPVELVSLELRLAWEKLGELTGETAADELLDHIFSEFCLGK